MFQEENSPFYTTGHTYRDFIVTKSVEIEEIQARLIELTHKPTGAQILHIEADDPENLFCLSFRTLPESSNGVAHILEHIVLCGSENYPLKDPFFSMNRRSLNTFMNALTGADFTCYPASSQVEQDFYNLLSVYIDAVFHPILNPLSFRQEGHRLEFANPQDPTTHLEFKGIVYNEMKGALSSPMARLHEEMGAALFPQSPYGLNSGGDPKEIPKLRYEELIYFHKKYYHPTHCLFFFYGNIPLKKHLDFISEKALLGVNKVPSLQPIPQQPRFLRPIKKETYYPVTGGESEENAIFIGFAWLTTLITDDLDILALSLIDSILMDTDASPLKMELLKSKLCKQAFAQLETESYEVPYYLTLVGCKEESVDELETIIKKTFARIVNEGISERAFEAALHQLEFERLEIGSNGSPFGLTLFARSALLKQHGGEAERGLKIHSLFQKLRETIQENPRYLQELIQKYLLNNPHFVRFVMKPSSELAEQESKEERSFLDKIQSGLSEDEKKKLISSHIELIQHQEKDEDDLIDLLPKIELKDIPKKVRSFHLSQVELGNLKIFHHPTFTNAITYADLIFPLPKVSQEELWYYGLFTALFAQLGCGNRTYQENLEYMQLYTGGVSTSYSFDYQTENFRDFSPSLHIKGKALHRNHSHLFRLIFDMANGPNFYDLNRLKELILKHWTNLQSSLPANALRYAIYLSGSNLNYANKIINSWYGLDYFIKIRDLANNIDERIESLAKTLTNISESILLNQGANLIITSDQTSFSQYIESGFEGLCDLPLKPFTPWDSHCSLARISHQAYAIPSGVASTAVTFQTVPYSNPAAPIISVASNIFDNTTLHKKIREQGGAYGGGSSHNPTAGFFYFYAMRDPNIASSIKAFEEAIKNISSGLFVEDDLQEAQREIIQSLDAPIAPGSRGEVAYSWWKEGKTTEMRQVFKNKVLNLTCKEVAEIVQSHIEKNFHEGTIITFANKNLIEQENKKLKELGHSALSIEKV